MLGCSSCLFPALIFLWAGIRKRSPCFAQFTPLVSRLLPGGASFLYKTPHNDDKMTTVYYDSGCLGTLLPVLSANLIIAHRAKAPFGRWNSFSAVKISFPPDKVIFGAGAFRRFSDQIVAGGCFFSRQRDVFKSRLRILDLGGNILSGKKGILG